MQKILNFNLRSLANLETVFSATHDVVKFINVFAFFYGLHVLFYLDKYNACVCILSSTNPRTV
jgi:hypothetical protein